MGKFDSAKGSDVKTPSSLGKNSSVAEGSPTPPYGKRKGFVPRNPEDFGNGGAYPECHIAQYPLGMGLSSSASSNAVAVYQNVTKLID